MKTTVEMPDALFAQARRYAKARNMTMKAMIEQGLRAVMVENKNDTAFRLRDASFEGRGGLAPEFQNASWS